MPAIAVKLNGVIARTKPSSGRYSIRFHTPGRADRLLLEQLAREVHVEAQEVGQLARRVDLGLLHGLRLPEHRRRVEPVAPRSSTAGRPRAGTPRPARRRAARATPAPRPARRRPRPRRRPRWPARSGRAPARAGAARRRRAVRRRPSAARRRSSSSARPARRPGRRACAARVARSGAARRVGADRLVDRCRRVGDGVHAPFRSCHARCGALRASRAASAISWVAYHDSSKPSASSTRSCADSSPRSAAVIASAAARDRGLRVRVVDVHRGDVGERDRRRRRAPRRGRGRRAPPRPHRGRRRRAPPGGAPRRRRRRAAAATPAPLRAARRTRALRCRRRRTTRAARA